MHYAMLVTNAVQREGVVVVVGGGRVLFPSELNSLRIEMNE